MKYLGLKQTTISDTLYLYLFFQFYFYTLEGVGRTFKRVKNNVYNLLEVLEGLHIMYTSFQ